MQKAIGLRSVLLSIACACSLSISAHVIADAKPINIPPGDLIVALESLAKQTGAELVYKPAELKGLRTRGVSGTLEPQAAVIKLLEGTPLALHTDSTGAMLIAAPLPREIASPPSIDHQKQSIKRDSKEPIANTSALSKRIVVMAQKSTELLQNDPHSSVFGGLSQDWGAPERWLG